MTKKAVNNPTPLVTLRNIAKSYQEGVVSRNIFTDLSGQFNAGEITALLGRSGCGKSTLLNLISGIDLPDSGSIVVNNCALQDMNDTERTLFRRHHIGFVFQSFNLIPTLTVRENVILPLEMIGESEKNRLERVSSILEQVGLQDRADNFPEQLSGGEQQRVAIARAISHKPRLLLADEPTGNLDAATGAIIMTLLESLVRDNNITLIIVTHSDEVAAIADQRLQVAQGQLTQTI